jgi:hypothetical protein
MFKTVLWIRNKLGLDSPFATFLNSQLFVRENVKARFDSDKVRGTRRSPGLKDALAAAPDASVLRALQEAEKKLDLFGAMTYLVLLHFLGKVTDAARATALFTQHELAPLRARPAVFEDLQQKFNFEFVDCYAAYLRTYLANPLLNQVYQDKVVPEELASDVLAFRTDAEVLQVAARALVQMTSVRAE